MPEEKINKPRARNRSPEFYSGKELEYDLFGAIDTGNPEYQKALKAAAAENGYVRRWEAMDLVKKFQSQDPTNPQKDFLRELRNSLTEIFDLNDEKEMDRVRAYTAIGSPRPTPLDVFHGIDAFITYSDKDGEYAVTFDASHRKKEEAVKADIIVGEMPDPNRESEDFLDMVGEIAQRVARNIARQKDAVREKISPDARLPKEK